MWVHNFEQKNLIYFFELTITFLFSVLLENSLKFINLTTGNIKKLSISFIDKEEFFKSTIFYVIDPQHESYELVTETLATEISVYCNKEPTGFTPELKELCLAKFDGKSVSK